jgi:hypothetical protein
MSSSSSSAPLACLIDAPVTHPRLTSSVRFPKFPMGNSTENCGPAPHSHCWCVEQRWATAMSMVVVGGGSGGRRRCQWWWWVVVVAVTVAVLVLHGEIKQPPCS